MLGKTLRWPLVVVPPRVWSAGIALFFLTWLDSPIDCAVAVPRTVVRKCPFSCETLELSKQACSDWRVGNQCFVRPHYHHRRTMVLCANITTGVVRVRERCRRDGSESVIERVALLGPPGVDGGSGASGASGGTGGTGGTGGMGETGPIGGTGGVGPSGETGGTGAQGGTGAVGASGGSGGTGGTGGSGGTGSVGGTGGTGSQGSLRVYGDGSAGPRSFLANTTFIDPNPQYTNFSVDAGVTLLVPSGTIIRCTGIFTNSGTITVQRALRDAPRFGENGRIRGSAGASGQESPGGSGGLALPVAVAQGMLTLLNLGAGNGYRESSDVGGDGGGVLTIIAQQAVVNDGTISASGATASGAFRGGGAGGYILLASATSVANNGTVSAIGGNGGTFEAVDSNSTGRGPGGGGGGGIVHFITPSIISTGTVDVSGGGGGSGGGPGSITGLLYVGGGGGGGGGGAGGDGGAVNPGNSNDGSCNSASNGSAGQLLQTVADPTSLLP